MPSFFRRRRSIVAASVWHPQEPPVFKAQSELVVLHVMVKDRKGSYVGGLTADAFQVLEEDRSQRIAFFTPEDAPVTVGLLIDSSGSMGPVRDRVITASAAFIQSSNPKDEAFAVVFNDDIRSVPEPPAHFVSDANTLRTLLAGAFVPAGRTRLYDAIAEGLSYILPRVPGMACPRGVERWGRQRKPVDAHRRADDDAGVERGHLHRRARRSPAEEANPKRLKQLADASGGAAFSPRDIGDVDKAFQRIARDIRSSYTIGYEPANTRLRPGLRRIRVEVHAPDGRRLVTRTRTAYLAGQSGEANHAR